MGSFLFVDDSVKAVVIVAIGLLTEGDRPAPDSIGFEVTTEWNHGRNSFSRRGGCTGFNAFPLKAGVFDVKRPMIAVRPGEGGTPISAKITIDDVALRGIVLQHEGA